MRREVILLLAVLGCSLLAGCGPTAPTQSPPAAQTGPRETPLRAKVVGKWTSTSAPELRDSATTISFLESGEYQGSGLAKVGGQVLTVEKDGKKEPLRVTTSGTWDLEGEEIHVRITQSGLQGNFKPFTYRVQSASEKRLVLDKEGEVIALFRAE
jgi:hypothetical protein